MSLQIRHPDRAELSGRLIVLEHSGAWAAELRRLGVAGGAGLRETRSFDECERELTAHAASLVLLVATTTNVLEASQKVFAWERQFPSVRAVVALAGDLRRWESVLRESGAVCVIDSPRRLSLVASLAIRHWREHPQRAGGPTDRVWASLPWNE